MDRLFSMDTDAIKLLLRDIHAALHPPGNSNLDDEPRHASTLRLVQIGLIDLPDGPKLSVEAWESDNQTPDTTYIATGKELREKSSTLDCAVDSTTKEELKEFIIKLVQLSDRTFIDDCALTVDLLKEAGLSKGAECLVAEFLRSTVMVTGDNNEPTPLIKNRLMHLIEEISQEAFEECLKDLADKGRDIDRIVILYIASLLRFDLNYRCQKKADTLVARMEECLIKPIQANQALSGRSEELLRTHRKSTPNLPVRLLY
jgi:hypothetical protein